jgi:phosphoribosylformylglycinamidine cyclo-ligase
MVTYKQAGVNINLANMFVEYIKTIAPEIGGFSGLYPIKGTDLLLAASTDGVGTKLKPLLKYGLHATAGIDLVAMNVNDLICCGAKPIFFLDYFACGKLDLEIAKKVITGIVEGCRQSECGLLGGETAEMPGFYPGKEFDLAGFAVGIVHKKDVINGSAVKPGDVILGVPSSGPHSNGFSLIRKVLHESDIKKYRDQVLAPTKIYVKTVFSVLNNPQLKPNVHAMAHITGGGFYDNIIRIIPKTVVAVINKGSWNIPQIFSIIQKRGNVQEKEMYRVLNMGIGLIMIVSKGSVNRIKSVVKDAVVIGEIKQGVRNVAVE